LSGRITPLEVKGADTAVHLEKVFQSPCGLCRDRPKGGETQKPGSFKTQIHRGF